MFYIIFNLIFWRTPMFIYEDSQINKIDTMDLNLVRLELDTNRLKRVHFKLGVQAFNHFYLLALP
jgi:hypothetical protein